VTWDTGPPDAGLKNPTSRPTTNLMIESTAAASAARGAATAHTGTPVTRAAASGGTSFAGQLARLVDAPAAATKAVATKDAATTDTAAAATKAAARPEGEMTKKVPGHPYASIENGADKGRFLNQLAGNARQGSVFKMVERDDRVFHVYGSGKDKVVVEVKAAGKSDATATPATGGTTPATS
jgi:hypothetical protein